MKSRYVLLALFLMAFLGAGSYAGAQAPAPLTPVQPPGSGVAAANAALAKVAPTQEDQKLADEDIDYIYEHPTMEKLSRMFWGISKLDMTKNEDIDNFLLINECEIFKDYYHNEFEWKTIRDSTRKFIDKNVHTFPLRFELVEPLKLGKYDMEKHHFEVVDEYKIEGVRKFEIMADDAYDEICGVKRTIDGYPRGMIVEISRPILLGVIPVDPMVAETYIQDKMKGFEDLSAAKQTDDALSQFRDAYLVMKVKFFAYKGEEKNHDGMVLANVMAILEGLEVYSDPLKKHLLYKENYRHKRKPHRGFREKLDSTEDMDVPNPNPNLASPGDDSDGPANDSDAGQPDLPPATPGKIEIPAYNPNGGAGAEQ